MGKPKKFLTTIQAAAYLEISRPTLYRLIEEEDITAYKILSNYRFTKEDLDDYLRRARIPSKHAKKQRRKRR